MAILDNLEIIDKSPLIFHAINEIYNTYGIPVIVSHKAKSLLKFGENGSVGTVSTGYTIWYTGQDQAHETYPASTTNPIDTISSSSLSDTDFDITIEGHTSNASGDLTFITQTASINAQTKVTLSTPLHRITRMANIGANDNVGEVYGYEDTTILLGKPIDTTKIHITMPAGRNQSFKASTSLSSTDYWIVTGFHTDYLSKTGSNFADVVLQIRELGGVFRPKPPTVVSTGESDHHQFIPYIIIPPNSDIRLVAVASASGQLIAGGIDGYLATSNFTI